MNKTEYDELMWVYAELKRLRADKEAISETASDYLHEIEALRRLRREDTAVIEELRRLIHGQS